MPCEVKRVALVSFKNCINSLIDSLGVVDEVYREVGFKTEEEELAARAAIKTLRDDLFQLIDQNENKLIDA